MSWKVEMTHESELQLIQDFNDGLITKEDVSILKKWIRDVEENGLEAAQTNRTWRDHALYDKWSGHRAISFSYAGRAIYRVEKAKVIVRVVKITHEHDYS